MLERLGKAEDAASLDSWKRALGHQVRHALEQFRVRGWPVLRVNYGECVADPGATIRRLKGFLGDRLDVRAMEQAVEPRLYRERSGGEGKNRKSE